MEFDLEFESGIGVFSCELRVMSWELGVWSREMWLEEKVGAAREHFRGPDGFLTPVR